MNLYWIIWRCLGNRGLFHFICPKTTIRWGMVKEQDEHMFSYYSTPISSYQIPHGLWNIIHLSPLITTRALSTLLYSLHILYIKHILVSRFIISFLSFFNQSYWYLPLFPIVPIFICISALHIFLSGLLVSASIPWPSCCLSFLLYKHCEYQKISDTGVATFFLLYLYSLCMYNIHLYTCIYLKIKVHLYFLRAQLVCKN